MEGKDKLTTTSTNYKNLCDLAIDNSEVKQLAWRARTVSHDALGAEKVVQ